jgi:hypothetical protein
MIASRTAVQQFVPGDAKARSRWARMTAASQKFYYTRFRLLNAAVPEELANISANSALRFPAFGDTGFRTTPLVIDANAQQYKTGTFVPKCVVISGAALRRKVLNAGAHHAMGWVGERALEAMGIRASDGISSDELRQKLQQAIGVKFSNATSDAYGDCGAPYNYDNGYITSVFPFDNYVIFNLKGQQFRLDYVFDPETRGVTLTGTPVKVEQEYVDVQSSGVGFDSFASNSKAPYIPTGLRVDESLVLPSRFTVSLGAMNSELRNPMFGEAFLNVDKVVAAYLADIKNGYHSPILPPAAPIPNVRMMFGREVRARGVQSPADFMQWVAANKHRDLSASEATDSADWAHAPGTDTTKWKLPMHNKTAVRNSMANFHTSGVPESGKPAAANKLATRAKSMGLTITTDVANAQDDSDVDAGGAGSEPRKSGGGSAQSDAVRRASDHQTIANDYNKMKDKGAADTAARHQSMADTYKQAATHYKNGEKSKGDAAVKQAKSMAQKWSINAGGPGSGPHKGASPTPAANSNDPKGDYTSRDAVSAELRKQGFKDDYANSTRDDGMRFFSKHVGYDPGMTDGTGHAEHTTTHSVAVNPDGSFTHTMNGMHEGKSVADLKRLSDTFKASAPAPAGQAASVGKGVLALRRVLDAATARLEAENKVLHAAASSKATVTAKGMHAHLMSKGFVRTGMTKSKDGTPVRTYQHPVTLQKAAVSANGVFALRDKGQRGVSTSNGKTLSAIQNAVK